MKRFLSGLIASLLLGQSVTAFADQGRHTLIFGKAQPNLYLESTHNSVGNRVFQRCSTDLSVNDAKCEIIGKPEGYIPANLRYRLEVLASNRNRNLAVVTAATVAGFVFGLIGYGKYIPGWISRWESPLTCVVESLVGGGRGSTVFGIGGAGVIGAVGYEAVRQNGWLEWAGEPIALGNEIAEDRPLVLVTEDLDVTERALRYLLRGL